MNYTISLFDKDGDLNMEVGFPEDLCLNFLPVYKDPVFTESKKNKNLKAIEILKQRNKKNEKRRNFHTLVTNFYAAKIEVDEIYLKILEELESFSKDEKEPSEEEK